MNLANSHNQPLVSVLLPVYNAEKYIKESIQSILDQTYSNFELIILNDGSADNSSSVIKSFKDSRIVYAEHPNIGLAATLNKGLGIAKGVYIARQDNDDISFPQRLEKQVAFFQKNPDIGLVGTHAEIIDENGKSTGRFHRHASDPDVLKFYLLFDNPFVHTSVMFRKLLADKVGDYYTGKDYFEDYNLWSRIMKVSHLANLPEVLVKYREVQVGMSKTSDNYSLKVLNQSVENIKYYSSQNVHDIIEFLNGKMTDKKSKKMLMEITRSFCEKEGIRAERLKGAIHKQILNIKRSNYNKIINSDNSPFISKLNARVKRKILFMFNKKRLS